MSHEAEQLFTKVVLTIQAATGSAAILSGLATISGLIFTWISIFAAILVILVNWEKGSAQFRKFFKKNHKKNNTEK